AARCFGAQGGPRGHETFAINFRFVTFVIPEGFFPPAKSRKTVYPQRDAGTMAGANNSSANI
ncbi:MAG: hypothetical protein ABSG69_19315, partial [Candidatus Acidiferrum sp.]